MNRNLLILSTALWVISLLFALSGCTENGRYQTVPIGNASYLVTDTRSGAVYVGDYSPDRRADTLILFTKPVRQR